MTRAPGLTVCIADDEPPARRAIEWLLSRHPDVTVAGSCGDAGAAVAMVRRCRPDVLFLDVQMPGGDGFEVLRALGSELPAVVFVTAFDAYAVRAFEAEAVDYLVKPFSDERFERVLARVRDVARRRDHDAIASRLDAMLHTIAMRPPADPPPVVVRDGHRTYVLPPSEIEWIEAEDYYVRIHAGDRQPLVRRSLQSLLEALEPFGFARVHRSAAVNLAWIRQVRPLPTGDAEAVLASGQVVRVSRSHRPALHARFTPSSSL